MDRRAFSKSVLCAAGMGSLLGGQGLATAFKAMAQINSDLEATTRTGGKTVLEQATIKELKSSLRGHLLLPSNDGYDEARSIWNGMIDKRPALIARCLGAADVRNAVDFARSHDLLVAVRAGGHGISGKAVCDGGIMIDVSPMRGVRVDPMAKTARVQGGSLLGDLDHESQAFGLATTTGTVSHTGVAGLTLGGGFGRLGRRFGLACDNLRAVDVITADGKFVRASDSENADLFWGVRGGGGNFGVVTSFEYQLHEVGPMVLAGNVMYPMDKAREVLQFYADFCSRAPDELSLDVLMLSPPNMTGFISVSACYSGPLDEGERILQPLREFGPPMAEHIGPVNYAEFQTRADAATPPGRLYYNKSGFMKDFTPAAIDTLVEGYQSSPNWTTLVIIQVLGGAIGRVGQQDTAFAHRDAGFNLLTMTSWSDPAYSDEAVQWLRNYFETVNPYTTGVYINYLAEDDDSRVRAAFRENYDRMVTLKNKYDPTNLFRLNANVDPTI